MNKLISTLMLLFIGLNLSAQTQLYTHPDFDKIAKGHEIIAVIPFSASVTLRPKEMKTISVEQLTKMEKAEGEAMQSGLYSWFLSRKKKGRLTVKIKSPANVNAELAKKGISVENYTKYTPKELADILEVDAIVMGTLKTSKPMSEGAALAMNLLVGWGFGSTNKAVMNLYIYNAEDGELLVNYNKAVSGDIGSSSEYLVNRLMRKASRRIAYTKPAGK